MEKEIIHIPVLIVGSGPTGLLSANLLGKLGIPTLLVERNATTSALPKAILLDEKCAAARYRLGEEGEGFHQEEVRSARSQRVVELRLDSAKDAD